MGPIGEENINAAVGIRTYISWFLNPQLEQCGQTDRPTEKLNKGLDLSRRSLPSVALFGQCFIRNRSPG